LVFAFASVFKAECIISIAAGAHSGVLETSFAVIVALHALCIRSELGSIDRIRFLGQKIPIDTFEADFFTLAFFAFSLWTFGASKIGVNFLKVTIKTISATNRQRTAIRCPIVEYQAG
jgi:hypothetical protein